MKIVYSTGNRIGGDIQLKRFLNHNKHDIKIASYLRSSGSLTHVDWILDACRHKYTKGLKRVFKKAQGQKPLTICKESGKLLLKEVSKYGPDLIISDGEPIMANIAAELGIKLWYCSPIHLWDGIVWKSRVFQVEYFSLLEKHIKFIKRKFPKADRKFIYSPFGDIMDGPELREGYEWIRPYYHEVDKTNSTEGIAVVRDPDRISSLSKILNCIPPFNLTLFNPYFYNLSHIECETELDTYIAALSNCRWLFSTGETSYISDAIYNGINRICIAPNLDDPELLFNSFLCKRYDIGDDLGQVEYMKQYAIDEIERSYLRSDKLRYKLEIHDHSYLHEEIDSEESSI